MIPLAPLPTQTVNRSKPNRTGRRQSQDASPQPRRYAKLQQAADYLNVNERTIRDMIADGRLIGYRSGPRIVRVDLNEIDAAMTPFGGAA